LKDFAGGLLNTCVAPIVATTATPAGSTNLPGTAQHDVADLSANTPTPTGSVQFFLCAPGQAAAAGCPAGAGTPIGTPVTLSSGTATSPTVNGSTTPNTNGIGKYCWGALYTPDVASLNRYLPAYGTDATVECFTVVKASPTIATQINITGN